MKRLQARAWSTCEVSKRGASRLTQTRADDYFSLMLVTMSIGTAMLLVVRTKQVTPEVAL